MSRGFKHNEPAETIAQHYLDDRSYLSEKNGRVHEILFGLDKSAQREKVYHQAKGLCQVCGRKAPLHDERGEGYEGSWHHVSNKPGERCDCLHNAEWRCGRFIAGCHSDAHPKPRLRSIPNMREYTDDMGEISGFGGAYEKACRDMVLAGIDWFDSHPGADPHFRGYKGIYGVLSDDNDEAKALSDYVVKASGGDCTGAMHQATIGHILWIHAHTWDEYVKLRREEFAKRKGAANVSDQH